MPRTQSYYTALQVRVEDSEDNMYASIDIVCDKIARKMSRVKGHAIAVGKWQGSARGQQDADLADQVSIAMEMWCMPSYPQWQHL